MFVIVRRAKNGRLEYVTRPGAEHSFTSQLESARTFSTKEMAQKEVCPENEWVVPVERLLQSME